jgi:hypothetical protein
VETAGNLEILRVLLERGGDATAQINDGPRANHNMLVAEKEYVDVFFDGGVDAIAKELCWWTPLHVVVAEGHVKVACPFSSGAQTR